MLTTGVTCAAAGISADVTVHASAAVRDHAVRADFNGDGYADLAIGAPGANGHLGAVDVLSGSRSGPSTRQAVQVTLDSLGVAGVTSRVGDDFGFALAAGDFNGDGFADLAVGAPGRSEVAIVFGSSRGLLHRGCQLVKTTRPFGAWSLAAADFNGDGYADLAVGDPFAHVGQPAAGAVEVYPGSSSGLAASTSRAAQQINQTTHGVPGPKPASDGNFGLALATGDFNGDGYKDLAIGLPGSGAFVLYGSTAGITTLGARFLKSFGEGGGYALASGDFNADGFSDLVIGAPQTFTAGSGAGIIEVHPGSASGITDVQFGSAPVFAEISPGMPGPPTADSDLFGDALATGDVNGDGFDDLVVGVPGKSAAILLRGSNAGLGVQNSQFLPGVGPHAGSNASATGVSLAVSDFNSDGDADVVLGEPFTTTTQPEAGVVELYAGSSAAVVSSTLLPSALLSESTAGMPGSGAGANDNFGLSLATTGG